MVVVDEKVIGEVVESTVSQFSNFREVTISCLILASLVCRIGLADCKAEGGSGLTWTSYAGDFHLPDTFLRDLILPSMGPSGKGRHLLLLEWRIVSCSWKLSWFRCLFIVRWWGLKDLVKALCGFRLYSATPWSWQSAIITTSRTPLGRVQDTFKNKNQSRHWYYSALPESIHLLTDFSDIILIKWMVYLSLKLIQSPKRGTH